MPAPKSRKPSAAAAGNARRSRTAAAPPDVRLGARTPVHPGRFLETRFLIPMGISQQALAGELGISRRRVNELIRGHRSITPDTAIRLAVFLGTDAAFWMGLQMAWDMHHALRAYRRQEKGPPRAR
jgi:addiction module HigA family antidote